MQDIPMLIAGGIAVDDRGALSFVNDFDMTSVKRFYQVRNHQSGFIRAWHAHKKEGKFVYVARGAAIVGAVKIDDWESPSKNMEVHRYILSSEKPSVLWIPPGYANGFKTLTDESEIIFFSTSTLEESKGDDIRYAADYWNPWEVEYR